MPHSQLHKAEGKKDDCLQLRQDDFSFCTPKKRLLQQEAVESRKNITQQRHTIPSAFQHFPEELLVFSTSGV